jgi:GNAT superfamily N-acetyltransferase
MTRKGCLVRPAELSDVLSILELCAELDHTHREQHPELFPPGRLAFRDAAWVERALADPAVGLFVAELKGAGSPGVSGFVRVVDVQTPGAGALASRRFGLVDDLAVATGARRAGLATELLAAAEDWTRKRGLEAMEVTVWAFNLPAQELYEKNGFGVLRHYLRKRLMP